MHNAWKNYAAWSNRAWYKQRTCSLDDVLTDAILHIQKKIKKCLLHCFIQSLTTTCWFPPRIHDKRLHTKGRIIQRLIAPLLDMVIVKYYRTYSIMTRHLPQTKTRSGGSVYSKHKIKQISSHKFLITIIITPVHLRTTFGRKNNLTATTRLQPWRI